MIPLQHIAFPYSIIITIKSVYRIIMSNTSLMNIVIFFNLKFLFFPGAQAACTNFVEIPEANYDR